MRRRLLDKRGRGSRHGGQDLPQTARRHDVEERIIARGPKPQSLEDVKPAEVGEQLARADGNASGAAIQLDSLAQSCPECAIERQ